MPIMNSGITNIGTTQIADDSILNADINSAAGIVDTKLATISTAGKVSGAALTLLDAAHISNVEQPAVYTAEVLGFLAQPKS